MTFEEYVRPQERSDVSSVPLLRLKRDAQIELRDTALVALQHLLPSITALFVRFINAGFDSSNMFVIGKPYSTVPDVAHAISALGCYVHASSEPFFRVGYYAESFRAFVNDFWRTVAGLLKKDIKRIVILDEGGWLLRVLPNDVIAGRTVSAIEHTTFGIAATPPGKLQHPIVLMAASAAKTQFESQVIADAIVERLFECVPSSADLQLGVIGLGNVGMAVSRSLRKKTKKRILGYDSRKHQGEEADFIERVARPILVAQSDVIVGCTGEDSLKDVKQFRELRARRWLASSSSGDFEFSGIARQLAGRIPSFRSNPFQDALGRIGSCHITLLNGGFPMNFDRKREREQPIRIQLTRELTFASVMQASLCLDQSTNANNIMLDPVLQQELVERWLNDPDASSLFPKWRTQPSSWWVENSAGQQQQRRLSEFIEIA